MATEPEPGTRLYNRRQIDPRRADLQRPGGPANLADILERVLDKGIVIAGDIQINLLDIELLTIKLRLLVASVERAQEMGINWWESDPTLSSRAKELEQENEDLQERLERLEQMAGLPAPRPGEEVVVETRHKEVVEEAPDGEAEQVVEEHAEEHLEGEEETTKDELLERAQELNVRGRSTMTKDELSRAVFDAEVDDELDDELR
jgi:gas vesicle protein GvpA/GvpJ/GvpM family